MRRTSANVKQSWHSLCVWVSRLRPWNWLFAQTDVAAYQSHATMSIYSSIYTAAQRAHGRPYNERQPHKVNRRLGCSLCTLNCYAYAIGRVSARLSHIRRTLKLQSSTHMYRIGKSDLCCCHRRRCGNLISVRCMYYRCRYTRRLLLLFRSFRSFVSPTAACVCLSLRAGAIAGGER